VTAFDEWMRPLVDQVQQLPEGIVHFAYPQTRLGLATRRVADAVMTSKPFAPLVAKPVRDADSDRPLPPLRTDPAAL
jgi:hypothetical protein